MKRFCCVPLIFLLYAPMCPGENLLIPFTALPALNDAQKVKRVVDSYTFHRQFNDNKFKSSPKVFDYLLDRMPLTSVIMRHLELEEYEIVVRDDGMMIYDDKQGMTGTFEPVYHEGNKRIFYGDGLFDAGILGDVRGESVVVMDCSEEEPDVMRNKVTVYIRVHGLLGPLCKAASPILNGLVSRKSGALLQASAQLSEQLTEDPAGVLERIRTCAAITPEQLADFRSVFLGLSQKTE